MAKSKSAPLENGNTKRSFTIQSSVAENNSYQQGKELSTATTIHAERHSTHTVCGTSFLGWCLKIINRYLAGRALSCCVMRIVLPKQSNTLTRAKLLKESEQSNEKSTE